MLQESVPDVSVLLVCNVEERESITTLLLRAIGESITLTWSAGGDDAVERFESGRLTWLVVFSELAAGDAESLVSVGRDLVAGLRVVVFVDHSSLPAPWTRQADVCVDASVTPELLRSALTSVTKETYAGASPAVEERVAPPRREPTIVMGAAPLPSERPYHAFPDASPAPGEAPLTSRGSSSDFGDVVRKKMDEIAARLFPRAPRLTPVRPNVDRQYDMDGLALSHADSQSSDESGTHPRSVRPAEVEALTRGRSDAAYVLARAFLRGFTGRCRFVRGNETRVVEFIDGRPLFASTNNASASMSELLVQRGQISRAQLELAQKHIETTPCRLGEALVALGHIKQREHEALVRLHLEELVIGLFAWRDGEVQWVPGVPTREAIVIARHVTALLLAGIRRKLTDSEIRDWVGDDVVVPTPVSQEAPRELSSLAQWDEEQQVVAAIDGARTLTEIAATSKQPLAVVRAVVLTLALLHAVTIREPMAAVGAAHVDDDDVRVDRARILHKLGQVQVGDYFSLLGIPPDATSFEVAQAGREMRLLFAPTSFARVLQEEYQRELELIALVVNEAADVLSDDDRRQAYVRAINNDSTSSASAPP